MGRECFHRCLSFCSEWGCGYVSNDDHQVSLAGGGYVGGVGYSRSHGILTPLVLIPSGGHQNTCSWQVGGTHPTRMLSCYHPRMWVGDVFGHVCLSVCLSVSVFLSVQAITFELLDIETSFLVCRYILIISRSSLSIKVIGSRSRSYEKK